MPSPLSLVMKKLADFELPYVSLRSSEVENCKVGLRKWWVSIVTVAFEAVLPLLLRICQSHSPTAHDRAGTSGRWRGKQWRRERGGMNKDICSLSLFKDRMLRMIFTSLKEILEGWHLEGGSREDTAWKTRAIGAGLKQVMVKNCGLWTCFGMGYWLLIEGTCWWLQAGLIHLLNRGVPWRQKMDSANL